MDNSSQRKILRVSPACEIPQLAGEITAALVGDGPTLGFGEVLSGLAPSQVAVVIATSGSIGAAKEVALTSKALIASARAANKFLGAKNGDRWSLLLPLTHVAAVNVIIRSMEIGTLPVDLRNFDGAYPRVNFTSIVPTQLFRALNGDSRLLDHLKAADKVLVGGAGISQGLRNQATAAGINIVTTYGMTETCGGCVYDGMPLDGVDVEIKNGNINIRGSVLASGYLNAEWSLEDGWYKTSDLGEITNDKLNILGRSDDVIITGGENISLAAVENLVTTNFPKIQCVAFGLDDPQWGQSLQLAIVGPCDESAISELLQKEIGIFAKPKGFHHLTSLPLLGIGKVDRKSLVKEMTHE